MRAKQRRQDTMNQRKQILNNIEIKKGNSKKLKQQSIENKKKIKAILKSHCDQINSEDQIREILDTKMHGMKLTQIKNVSKHV